MDNSSLINLNLGPRLRPLQHAFSHQACRGFGEGEGRLCPGDRPAAPGICSARTAVLVLQEKKLGAQARRGDGPLGASGPVAAWARCMLSLTERFSFQVSGASLVLERFYTPTQGVGAHLGVQMPPSPRQRREWVVPPTHRLTCPCPYPPDFPEEAEHPLQAEEEPGCQGILDRIASSPCRWGNRVQRGRETSPGSPSRSEAKLGCYLAWPAPRRGSAYEKWP